ncbi:MAG: glycosyltransferase, partial [Isosphaeraceae bacterium]
GPTVSVSDLVSIVLPVHNQADHIEAVVTGYEAALSKVGCRHELILVCNNCRDQSLSICQELARSRENIRVINSLEGGWGLAVKLGLKHAAGAWLAYTNSARTRPDQLAAVVLQALVNPDSAVKASRQGRTGMRMLGSSLYNIECRYLFNIACSDVNGTPKVFPRGFDRLLSLTRDDDLIDLEFLVVCRREGYRVLEVPIFSGKRHGGDSTTRLASALRLYSGAYRMWRNHGK